MKQIIIPLEKWGIKDLKSLENVKIRRYYDMPNCGGVYLLCVSFRPIYIGRASNMRYRINQHIKSGRLNHYFDKIRSMRVFWIRNYTREVYIIERTLIKHFNPVLNKQCVD